MSSAIPPTPPSPGVGVRRKGPKTLPRLPLSAFSPPNSGTSERFPLAPSPSAVHPDKVIDSHVALADGDASLNQWATEAGQLLGGRIGGVVVFLHEKTDVEKAISQLQSTNNTPIVSVVVPFNLADPVPTAPPSYLSTTTIPVSLSTILEKSTPESVASLKWAFEQNRPIDIDVPSLLTDAKLEDLEDLVSKASDGLPNPPPIILSNVLPPPHDLDIPIVRLITHPSYRTFQSQVAALSLIPNVHIKFLPPSWNAATPSTPPGHPQASSEDQSSKQKKEWKRRIKMYLGPVLEAFGYERIIFGSSPSSASNAPSSAGDWYEIAKESLTELSVEQEAVDAVFAGNAQRVYGSTSG